MNKAALEHVNNNVWSSTFSQALKYYYCWGYLISKVCVVLSDKQTIAYSISRIATCSIRTTCCTSLTLSSKQNKTSISPADLNVAR